MRAILVRASGASSAGSTTCSSRHHLHAAVETVVPLRRHSSGALKKRGLADAILLLSRPPPRIVPQNGSVRFCGSGTKKTPSKSAKSPLESSNAKKETSGGVGNKEKGSEGSSPWGRFSKFFPPQLNLQTLGAAAGIMGLMLYLDTTSTNETSEAEMTIQGMMREYLIKGYVNKIQIVNKDYCRVYLRPDTPGITNRIITIQLGTPEAFEAKIEQLQSELGLSPLDHVAIQYVNETDMFQELLARLPLLLTFMAMVPLLLMGRGMMGGAPGSGGPGGRNMFNMGKAMSAGQKELKSKVKFSDVAGLEQAKAEVVEFVDFLKHPAKYERLGARVPKGGLLVGPPGTGKTLLAKAVAGEADVPFYSMSGSEFVEMFVGVGPSRVRDLFKQARDSAPSIIFIDEIDAVGRKRGSDKFSPGGNDESENTLNQMLVEMDGFSSGTGVVVLAGTNRADILDAALTRAGRFDRQIAISKPDLSEREAIFMVHLKPVTIDSKLSSQDVAKRLAALTPGFVGCDIANLCNEAAIFAARRNSPICEMKDFEQATERILGGLPKQNSLMNAKEKHTVALHESGHAVAGWFMEHADPLLKVSIVPRSNGALGFAQYLPDEISLFSKEAVLDKIAVALAGRAAEELFVGKITTGAADDLDKVTKMAYSLVSVYGMNSELGLLSYSPNQSGDRFYKPYSEETSQKIDREARSIVEEQYNRVKTLLTDKKNLMMALANKLADRETLVYNELLDILGDRPFKMKDEYKQFVTAGANPFAMEINACSEGVASSNKCQ